MAKQSQQTDQLDIQQAQKTITYFPDGKQRPAEDQLDIQSGTKDISHDPLMAR